MTRSRSLVDSRRVNRRQVLKYGGATVGGVALGPLSGGVSVDRLSGGPSLSMPGLHTALAVAPANPHFQRVWERTDYPVAQGVVNRTWMWGPTGNTGPISEGYVESPGGVRIVQYFDKSRMEITNPNADPESEWYVTNGLLVVELITGNMQLGHNAFAFGAPAEVNVAGDTDDPDGPTYATFAGLLDSAPLAVGSTITLRVNRQGDVTIDNSLADQQIIVHSIDPETNHSIAAPFWAFMTSSGTVYQNGQYSQASLFSNPYFATGRPISEPYWTEARVAGTPRLVLVQCFERRVLTYTPGNPPGWQVEAGNVGLHYFIWRYGDGEVPVEPEEPEVPVDPVEPEIPDPEPGVCLMPVSDAKEKQSSQEKLQQMLSTVEVPSVLGAAALHMSKRFLMGAEPANELEADAFAVLAELPATTKSILSCALDTFDLLPEEDQDKLLSPAVKMLGNNPLTVEWLADQVAEELLDRASLGAFGNIMCARHEDPGQVRFDATLNYAGEFPPALIKIHRVNGLRVSSYEPQLAAADFLPHEIELSCYLGVVDGTTQVICETLDVQCPGILYDGLCMKAPDVRAGDAIFVEGASYYDVDATVWITSRTQPAVQRYVPAHVCGDKVTPVSETVNGNQVYISDSRVKDKLSFRVPDDLPAGYYDFMVLVPNSLNVQGYGENLYSVAQSFQVLPPINTTFQIVADQLFCIDETGWTDFFSDEVGLRVVTIPIGLDLTPGEAVEQKFPIFDDVDSGETRNLNRILFQGSGIAGLAMTIIGMEVDSKKAYEEQVQGLADAYVLIIKDSWYKIASAIGSTGGKALATLLGIGKSWAAAIGAAIGFAVTFFIALWAPADLIIEDVAAHSLQSLAVMTSLSHMMPLPEAYTSAGGIDVKVVPLSKNNVEYRERREYISDEEDSEYHITFRYNAPQG